MEIPEKPVNLKRSARISTITSAMLIISIVLSFIIAPLFKSQRVMVEALTAVPILVIFVISPFGLFFSLRSYTLKEGVPKDRFKYLIGHALACVLMLVFIVMIVSDFV